MNRALTLKWFAVLGLASLFYLLAPRDVSTGKTTPNKCSKCSRPNRF